MSNSYPVKISRIIAFTAITTILAGWHNSQSVEQRITAVDNFSLDSLAIARNRDFPDPTLVSLVSELSRDRTKIAALEQLAFEQVNQYRTSLNLAPLKLNPQISEQARIHSENMAQSIVPFSHDGFELRIEALKSKISYRSAAENVAYNLGYTDPVSQAVEGWIKSPGHRKNMTGNYNLTGIGVAKNHRGEYYLTQIFILEP